tara:strand:+ start:10963 stop:12351 length:1389 start_codon:yes stop_codon:yes gene_type:complete
MSFNINTKEIGDFDKIYYHYPTHKIYKTQYEKTIENGGYIKVAYPQQPNIINIDYAEYESGYVTKNLYISKKVHTIDSVEFDGELLIEHVSSTNGYKPLYVCIPLKTNTSSEETYIDKIIAQNEGSITYDINELIGEKEIKTILYESPGYLTEQYVILFTNPIVVKSSFDAFQMVDVVKDYDESYQIIIASRQYLQSTTPTPNVEGFQSKGKTKTSTAYCQPIEEIEPEVQNEASLEIPLKGKYSLKDSEYEYIKTVVSFTSYFLVMIFGYLGAPSFYKQFVIDLVNDNPKLATCMAKAGRLYSADIYICVVMIMFIYSLLSTGVKTNSKGKTTTALLVFIFFIVALLRIYFFKITPNSEFSEMIGCEQPEDGEEPDENDPNQYVVENIQQDLAEFFTENMSVFNSIQVFGIFIFLFLITMSILLATNSISLWFFGTLLDIYIIIFYVVKSNANKGGDDDEE